MQVEHPVILLPALTSGIFLLGVAFYPSLRLPRWPRMAYGCLLGVPMLLSPLLIAPERRLDRFIIAICAISMFGKIMDVHVARRVGHTHALGSYLKYLVHPFSLVQRRLHREPTHEAAEEVRRIVRGAIIAIIGAAALWWAYRFSYEATWFFFEHALKTLSLMTTVYGAGLSITAMWRLAGGRAREPFHNFFAARTPAEFWRRYNRLVSQFFHENMFRQIARRSPIGATLAVFAISGLVHEYVFGIAAGRVQFIQMAFFMLNGCAVIATIQFKPTGRAAVAATIATFLFMLATSMLFFASWNQIGPHYSDAAPGWMKP